MLLLFLILATLLVLLFGVHPATAVGTVVTRKRAMTIGITKANKTVKKSDSPSMIKSLSSLITFFLLYNKPAN